MADKRRPHSGELKEDAVRLLESGRKTGREIAEDMGIGRGVICPWRQQLEQEHQQGITALPGTGDPWDEELARLRKELAEVREERDILQKAVAILSKKER